MIFGCAIEVHDQLANGFQEIIYQSLNYKERPFPGKKSVVPQTEMY